MLLLERIDRVVMPALVAGIHVFDAANKDVDGRNESGHDELSGRLRPFGRVIDVRFRGCAIPAHSRGRGEMVDARDLKSDFLNHDFENSFDISCI
jgi:hypothetical protein